jgi:hypothetical protein
MPQVQTKKVTFKVVRAVELEPGLVLPPGLYTGTKRELVLIRSAA